MSRGALRPRLWPALLILLGAGLWLARTWLTGDAIRQERVVATLVTSALAILALTLWLGFFSRFPRKTRVGGVGAALLLLGLLAALFRVRGVSGDLLPILEPRWARRELAPRPALQDAPKSVAAPLTEEPPASATPQARRPAATPKRGAGPAYPQFLGPGRDATLPGPRLARDWSVRPPRRLWRQPIGAGWSGFAVADGLAITQEQRGAEEQVVAYQASTGRRLWSHADPVRYETLIAGVGPRATPTLYGGRVLTMGATGILNALELSSGRALWRRDVLAENAAEVPSWGLSCSPLVVEGRAVVSAGGSEGRRLVAYDVATGESAWTAGSGAASYSSPVLATLGGRRQLVVLNGSSVAGHDPTTGAVLWEHPFPPGQPNVATPLALPGDRLLVSVGYGVGAKAYRLQFDQTSGELAARLEWESPRLKSKFANLIWYEGFVYGLDDGVLTCLDPGDGQRRWKAGRYGHGQLLLVGELLLVQTESGEIVLVEPNPEEHRELTRFPALDGKTWNPPALAGRLLIVRNDREAAAYELPTE